MAASSGTSSISSRPRLTSSARLTLDRTTLSMTDETWGVLRWKVVLPAENGLNIIPESRARFTPDGQTAFIGTSIPGQTSDGYSYLYSVQTGSAPATAPATLSSFSLNPTSVTGGNTSKGTVTLTAAAPSGGAAVSLT